MGNLLILASRSAKPHQRTLRWPVLAALLWTATPATAEIHAIDTSGARWRPRILFIQPGDTVVWHGMESHETQLIDGLAPDGATGWRSALDEEGFSVTLHVEGAYLYTCLTHMRAGMVGAIVVGNSQPENLAVLKERAASVPTGRNFVLNLIRSLRAELGRRTIAAHEEGKNND